MNPYLVLHVPRDADDARIRRAYLDAVKEATPETHPVRFQEIAVAYEKIKDEASRWRYELFDTVCPGDSPLDVFLQHARLTAQPAPLGFEAMKRIPARLREVMTFPADETTPRPDAPASDPTPPSGESEVNASEREAWKDDLRRDFETWLASLDEIPEGDGVLDEPADDAPDLYSFYEQFAAAGAESRKANRRTAEAMSQWGETLARFESDLRPLRETAAQLSAAQSRGGQLPRPQCLVLVEMLDRMHRLARASTEPPVAKPSWWARSDDAAWRKAWESQHQALDILAGHLEDLLRKEGVVRIETDGQPFNPAVMMAVAAEKSTTLPPQMVLEETGAGYLRHGELLRPAHVKVSI